MYTLYHNRKEKIIEVKKAKKAIRDIEYTDEVTFYNSCYFICLKRKPLMDKTKEIKQNWISELKKEIESIEAIRL